MELKAAVYMIGPIELLIVVLVLLLLLLPIAVVIALVWVFVRQRQSDAANPNLMQCPDCHSAVSQHASSCPKCGCPLSSL